MLMQRFISVLVLVPLVLLGIFQLSPWVLREVLFLLLLWICYEYWQLIPLTKRWQQMLYLLIMVFCLWACGAVFLYWQTVSLLCFLFLLIAIVTYPKSKHYWGYPAVVCGFSLIVLPFFAQSLLHLFSLRQGKELLVYALFLIWAADIGAYLVGRAYGRCKLIPQVSPGKSWEGILGGFFLAMFFAVAGYIYFIPYSLWIWLGLAAVTVLSGVFGDLFISMLKRRCHVKDTGTLIPGHGGILDRLDSLIVALPVYYFGLTFIPIGI